MKLNSLPCVKQSDTIVMSTTMQQRSRSYNRQKKKPESHSECKHRVSCDLRQRCFREDPWGSGNWAVLMHMHSMRWGKVKEADSIFISQLLNIGLHCLNISVTTACIVQRSLERRRLKMKLGKKKPTTKKKQQEKKLGQKD